VGVASVAGVVEQDVRVEVAPGELAHERVGARAAALAGALLERARRDAPEVQVRRELGGPAREPVVALVVAIEALAQPRGHPLAARPLAGRERVRRLRLGCRGQAADREARGEFEPPRGVVDLAARRLLPRAGRR
jgi:hypothetical protein